MKCVYIYPLWTWEQEMVIAFRNFSETKYSLVEIEAEFEQKIFSGIYSDGNFYLHRW